jgi:hypothetical protein
MDARQKHSGMTRSFAITSNYWAIAEEATAAMIAAPMPDPS